MFLKNVWYVVCMLDELVGDMLFGCCICDEVIVFFWGVDGVVVVLEDFCLYCGVLLLLGCVVDGVL